MKTQITPPVYDRDESYERAARTVRWVCLGLVLISFPFTASNTIGIAVFTLLLAGACYNALRYTRLQHRTFFISRSNMLAIDHLFVLGVVIMSGGLSSPYYPFFFLLIIAVMAQYGVPGFAFSLGAQVLITLVLSRVSLIAMPISSDMQLVVKVIFLVVFCLVAEQSVRSRDEEYLLETRFTTKLGNERQRLLSLINSLTSGVMAVNQKGNVYLYNGAALELLDTNADITDQPLGKLLPMHDQAGKKIDLLSLASKHPAAMHREDLLWRAADGSDLVLDITLTPVKEWRRGQEYDDGFMVVWRDITREKTLEEQRDEFISVTSHELRTPLAIAEANLSTAMLPGYAKIEPKADKLIHQAYDNIIFLTQLVSDLTTLSHAERGDVVPTASLVNIPDFFNALKSDYTASATAKHLKLDVQLEQGVDSTELYEHETREILQNFITNAIKYTQKGSVTLVAERKEGKLILSVRDTGIGVAAADKPRLFGKFFRSEDYRTRETNGTGLGLYITHKLAARIGAEIGFDSRLNHGSTFWLKL